MSPPPQAPPVRRPEMVDPYTVVGLTTARTPAQHAGVRARLLFDANVNDPAAFSLPSYEQARLSAV